MKTKKIDKVYQLLTNNERVSLSRLSSVVANPRAAVSYLRQQDGLDIIVQRKGGRTFYSVVN
jgi:hypothetical protein